MKRVSLIICFLVLSLWAQAQGSGVYPIVVSSLDYRTIDRFTSEDFVERVKRELRLNVNAALHEDVIDSTHRRVYVTIGMRQYNFLLSPETPMVRLSFDRVRRQFKGMGSNFYEGDARQTPPTFKGHSLTEIPALWIKEINRRIGDRTLLGSAENPSVFILEATIDEQGNVQRVVEIGGGLNQYAQVLIDYFYDQAVRGWEPAKRRGIPFRSTAQLRFELVR